jgi:hypothetical protein
MEKGGKEVSKIRKMMNHPIMNKLCHRYQWFGKLLCWLDINHSLVMVDIRAEPFEIVSKCKYCGKEFRGEKK